MIKKIFNFTIFIFFTVSSLSLASPLNPVKLDTPRDTFATYLEAMNDYVKGVKTNDPKLKKRIYDTARCFNLEHIPYLAQAEKAKETALLLKEVLDRVIIVKLDKIPNDTEKKRWRLKNTEIVIKQATSEKHAEEYLFSQSTVDNMKSFYDKVKDLPYLDNKHQGAYYQDPIFDRYSSEWMRGSLFGLKKWQWLGVFLGIFIGFILKAIFSFIVLLIKKIICRTEQSTRFKVIEAIEKPVGLLAAGIFWFFLIHNMRFEDLSLRLLLAMAQITMTASVFWAAYKLIAVISEKLTQWADKTESELDNHLIPLIAKSLRAAITIFGILVIIQNLGFNVMSVLAGLGLGGLAFALAAKDTAANLFGSIMILLDRPFRIGDWIIADSVEGNVEDIGFRSTRLRTFYNSVISVPNSVLANTNIDNMGQRQYRRTLATLGLTYNTPPAKVESFITGVKQIILDNPHTRKDYFHVIFDGYGDSSLNIMLYYFFQVGDWTEELKQKENVNLAILHLAEDIGVQFAFPTQSLHIESLPRGDSSVSSI